MSALKELVRIMAKLRSPEGCPWDLEQTHQSLKKYAVEEVYELLDAIDSNCDSTFKEELGDVLLQVVFHAQLASERGAFSLDDVIAAISKKLIDRHPHVFGDVRVADSAEVLVNWEKNKLSEGGRKHVLDGVPRSLPALLMTHRIAEKMHARVSDDAEMTVTVTRDNVGETLEKIALLASQWGLDPEEELRLRNLKKLRTPAC